MASTGVRRAEGLASIAAHCTLQLGFTQIIQPLDLAAYIRKLGARLGTPNLRQLIQCNEIAPDHLIERLGLDHPRQLLSFAAEAFTSFPDP